MRPTKSFPALCAVLALSTATPVLAQSPVAAPSKTQQVEQDALSVAKSPLKDVGAIKDEIPQVLIDARTATYALPSPLTCATIFDAIDALNLELPPDLDSPETQIKSGMSATEIGQTVVHGLVPLRSWVRKLSGAEKNDNNIRAAIMAGSIRRGYLKGIGLDRGCKPPAAPLDVALPPEAKPPVVAKPKPKKR